MPATVTTAVCTDLASTSITANGNITNVGTANPYRRGFAYAEGLNYCLSFDGVDDVVTIPHSASLSNIEKLTVEVWIYRTGDGDSDFPIIATRSEVAADWTINEWLSQSRFMFRHEFTTTAGQWYCTAPPLNTWTLVKVVYDASNVANDPVISFNGASQAITEQATPVGSASYTADHVMKIGNRASGTRSWEGYIDELKVTNDTTLVGHWKFDEGSGSSALDETANGNDGTITGAVYAHAMWDLMPLYIPIANPSFEAGDPPTGWTATGAVDYTFTRSNTQVKLDTYAAKLTTPTSGWGRVMQAFAAATYAGHEVTFGAWVWASVASAARLRIAETAGAAGQTYSGYHTGSSAWEWLTVTRTLDAATTAWRIDAPIASYATATTFYADGVFLVEGDEIPAVFDDGDFSTGVYDIPITGLTAGKTYRVRAWAVNSEGISYGVVVTALTTSAGWSNIAKISGITATDLASIDGVLVADIAKINGVAV